MLPPRPAQLSWPAAAPAGLYKGPGTISSMSWDWNPRKPSCRHRGVPAQLRRSPHQHQGHGQEGGQIPSHVLLHIIPNSQQAHSELVMRTVASTEYTNY